MNTDYRALCADLAGWIERSTRHYIQDPEVLIRARAALAEPVAERPTLLLPCPFCGSKNLRYDFCASQGCMVCDDCDAVGPSDPRAADPICDDDAAVAAWNRRAALARRGRPAPAPAGEVVELVALIRQISLAWEPEAMTAGQLTRAAELLEQRHPAPVPVSERLPGSEDCDEKGCCWLWSTDDVDGVGHWSYSHRDWAQEGDVTHWFPATALPLPAEEVE